MPEVSSPSRLVGRARECEVLAELVVRVQSGESGVLVLEGEAGVGKSALLVYLADQAEGCRTVRATGIQSEMEVAVCRAAHGLRSLSCPASEGLPAPQREALEVAFGLRGGQAPGHFMVCLAALTLLTDAAETQPVICVVDDAQWLDRASAQTLSFVARRLLAEKMAMVFALRAASRGSRAGRIVGVARRGSRRARGPAASQLGPAPGRSTTTCATVCCGRRMEIPWPSSS